MRGREGDGEMGRWGDGGMIEQSGYDFENIIMVRFPTGKCAARFNKTIGCKGEYIPSQGACVRHAVLFDFWIDNCGGHRVYLFEAKEPTDPETLDRWKRSKFHRWLNTLTDDDVKRIEQS